MCIRDRCFPSHCLLWPWPLTFWPHKLLSTSTNPCYQNWVKFISLVLRYGDHNTNDHWGSHTNIGSFSSRQPSWKWPSFRSQILLDFSMFSRKLRTTKISWKTFCCNFLRLGGHLSYIDPSIRLELMIVFQHGTQTSGFTPEEFVGHALVIISANSVHTVCALRQNCCD